MRTVTRGNVLPPLGDTSKRVRQSWCGDQPAIMFGGPQDYQEIVSSNRGSIMSAVCS